MAVPFAAHSHNLDAVTFESVDLNLACDASPCMPHAVDLQASNGIKKKAQDLNRSLGFSVNSLERLKVYRTIVIRC